MKYLSITMFLLGSVLTGNAAYAGSDDLKWVAQCIQDNAGASVGADVVATYCGCMNNKMSDNESQSISQWEKTHTTEKNQCEAAAGWK